MAFCLPDLVVESVIRQGLATLRAEPRYVDYVFKSLTYSYLADKYGQAEIDKIKTMIADKSIAIVHAFHLSNAHTHSISIQLSSDIENQRLAHLDDFEDDVVEAITDPVELAALVKLVDVVSISYDMENGIITLDPSTDLSEIHAHQLFIDASDIEHSISSVIDTPTIKQLLVVPGSDVDISDFGSIKSSVDYKQYEQRGVIGDQQILIGVHSVDALTAKYLYMLLKYILISSKKELIQRNFLVSSYQGSDFTRNLQYQGDVRFTRFLTLTGKVEDDFRSDEVIPLEYIGLGSLTGGNVVGTQSPAGILVEGDVATTEDIGKEDQTIQIAPKP